MTAPFATRHARMFELLRQAGQARHIAERQAGRAQNVGQQQILDIRTSALTSWQRETAAANR